MNMDVAAALACELAEWAGARMLARPQASATKAHPADIVTDADVEIEAHVRARIAEVFPGHGVEGEEAAATAAADGMPTWYVDPIDGTTNFASGLGWSSFSLALAGEEGPLLGVVADPYRGEVFSARRGSGAWLNGAPIRCAARESLHGTVVLTEWNSHRPWPGASEMIERLAAQYCTVRVMGSSALSLANLAAGRAAGVVLGSFHPVDCMAGALIAAESGAHLDVTLPSEAGVLATAPGQAAVHLRAVLAPLGSG